MKLLFNKEVNNEKQGQAEIKATLGFLSADLKYANVEPDIVLRTPELSELVGQAVYEKLTQYYNGETSPAPVDYEKELLDTAIRLSQLFVLSMAYLDYAPDNDLTHGNDGRTVRSEEDQEKPFEWQVNKSNSSMKKRAYRALDQLFSLLDQSGWSEWTDSEQYKKSKSIFIQNTGSFDEVFPINRSGQLYYRLVPFMADIEGEDIRPILGPDGFDELLGNSDPSEGEKKLISLIRKSVAYLSLAKGLKAFPVEMFPDGIFYYEKSRSMSEARAEVMQFLQKQGENYQLKLEYEYKQQNQTFEDIPLAPGLKDGQKHVDL